MRISDWTSDVCSSDLAEGRGNITINGTYRKEQAVYQGARGYSFDALAAADFSPGGSFTNAPGFVDLGPDGYQFDAGGNLIDLGANPGAFEPFNFRSEEHTSELQSLMRNSYAVFCLKKKNKYTPTT